MTKKTSDPFPSSEHKPSKALQEALKAVENIGKLRDVTDVNAETFFSEKDQDELGKMSDIKNRNR